MRGRRKPHSAILALFMGIALVLSACVTHGDPQPPPNPITASPDLSSQEGHFGPKPIFYDFEDIPIPMELNIVQNDSYVLQAVNQKGGLLTLRGRVDINSVINFFQSAMSREGWRQRGGFRYRRSVLLFEKPDKTCMINIYEKLYYTYVEVYVVPSTDRI